MSNEEPIPTSPEWVKPMVHEIMTKAYNQGIDHAIEIVKTKIDSEYTAELVVEDIISQLNELKKP